MSPAPRAPTRLVVAWWDNGTQSNRKEYPVPPIEAVPGLEALGWDDGWVSVLAELRDPTLSPARVSRVDRGMCTLLTGSAEVRVSAERGMDIGVGDWVGVGETTSGAVRIMAVLPRRCVFRREASAKGGIPPQIVAANIDTVLLCDALDGRLSLRHLERFLALAWQSGATPAVLMTKSDMVPAAVLDKAVEEVSAVSDGVQVLVVSSTTGEGMADVAPYLAPGRTVALVGLSGAGKSTLVNLLVGADIVATGEVRADGSGRHTTTHRELILLPGGGLLIDTPGMRSLSVVGAGDGVEQAFRDVEVLAEDCMYANCSHGGEQGCALAEALSDGQLERGRFEAWLRLKAEPASSDIETTRVAIAERKRRKAEIRADRRAPRT